MSEFIGNNRPDNTANYQKSKTKSSSCLIGAIALIIIGVALTMAVTIANNLDPHGSKTALEKTAVQSPKSLPSVSTNPVAEPAQIQKIGHSQTAVGLIPLWSVADSKCILISRFDPKITRLSDGWVIEFGGVATVIDPKQLKQLEQPRSKKKRNK